MHYINISDYINVTHQKVLLSGSYLPPICSLPGSHAETNKIQSSLDQVNLITDDPEIPSIIKPRAPPQKLVGIRTLQLA